MLNSEKQSQLSKLKILEKLLFHSGLCGNYQSFVKGSAMDFLQLREYHDGDDTRFLDWNSYAKTGNLSIKETTPERDRAIVIALDCSTSNMFSSQKKLKSDLALELTSTLSFLALHSKDNLGLLTFGRDETVFLPFGRDRHQYFSVFNLATEKMGEMVGSGVTKALEFLINMKRKKTLVFLISDFITDDFFAADKHWQNLKKKHHLIPIVVSDPREHSLDIPQMLLQCEDSETGELTTIETSSFLNKFLQERIEEQINFFKQKELRPLQISTNDDLIHKLIDFFGRK